MGTQAIVVVPFASDIITSNSTREFHWNIDNPNEPFVLKDIENEHLLAKAFNHMPITLTYPNKKSDIPEHKTPSLKSRNGVSSFKIHAL